VRAAPVLVDPGPVRLHGEAVAELAHRLGGVVQVDDVGAGDVVDRLAGGVQRGGQGVERQLLHPVAPDRVARDPGEDLVAEHILDDPARFEALARIGERGPHDLVAREAAAGELPVVPLDRVVQAVRSHPVGVVAGEHPVLGRLPESLRHVDVVQVRQAVPPVRRAGVDLVDQIDQERVAGAVVEPVDDVDRFAPAPGAPAVGEHRVGLPVHVLEEPGQEGVDPGVAGVLGVRAQRVQHRHVRP
jgi:hypothetical protein